MQQKPSPVRVPPFPFEGELQDKFEKALEAAAIHSYGKTDDLRYAVCQCVKELQRQGMPPEGVIVTLRAYLRHTAKDHFPIPPGSSWALNSLYEKLAEWCIDTYYNGASD